MQITVGGQNYTYSLPELAPVDDAPTIEEQDEPAREFFELNLEEKVRQPVQKQSFFNK